MRFSRSGNSDANSPEISASEVSANFGAASVGFYHIPPEDLRELSGLRWTSGVKLAKNRRCEFRWGVGGKLAKHWRKSGPLVAINIRRDIGENKLSGNWRGIRLLGHYRELVRPIKFKANIAVGYRIQNPDTAKIYPIITLYCFPTES